MKPDSSLPAAASYGPQQLAQDLQRLIGLPSQTEAEQSARYEEAQQVIGRIQSSKALHAVPHSVWHFLFDADVRAKVPAIHEAQVEQLRGHISVLATGALPPDDSTPVGFGDLIRSLWHALRRKGKSPAK